MILYLHGFRSSPLSVKARAAADYMERQGLSGRFFCPQLPESPVKAVMLAAQFMEGHDSGRILLIGSSLGGYYANWLAERTGCRAVLLNPVIDPWDVKALGSNAQKTPELMEWESARERYALELRAFQILGITRPERYFLIAATGDALLDYRQMSRHYRGARQIIIDGDDHSLSGFADYLDEILAFADLNESGVGWGRQGDD